MRAWILSALLFGVAVGCTEPLPGDVRNASADAASPSDAALDARVMPDGGEDPMDASLDATTDIVVTGGEITIDAAGDGLNAETILFVAEGVIDVVDSYEGLESAALTIAGGTVDVVSSDDGLNGSVSDSAGAREGDGSAILISGGVVTVFAGGDGIDSNGDAAVTGGTVIATSPFTGPEAAMDTSGDFSGSSFVWTNVAAQVGDIVQVVADDGTVVVEYTTVQETASIFVASPQIEAGVSYTVTVAGSVAVTVVGDEILEFDDSRGGGGQRP